MLFALHIVFDVASTFLLLLLAWMFTDKLPILDRWVNVGQGHSHPIPPDEPDWQMVVFFWVLPLLFLCALHLFFRRQWQKTALVALSFFNVMALVIFITSLIRYFLPKPRPYFMTKCNSSPSGYMNDPTWCTSHMTRHDRQSFPSGHVSLAWGSWFFVLLVVSNISGAFSGKVGFWRMIPFFGAPLLIPLWTSCDRVMEGNHFAADVVTGIVIGITTATFSYYNMETRRLEVKTV